MMNSEVLQHYMFRLLDRKRIVSINSAFGQFSCRATCKRVYGLGSQCRPNECLFGSGKTPGGRDFGRGARWAGEGNVGVSLRATLGRGGQILSQQGGFQVSGKGQ